MGQSAPSRLWFVEHSLGFGGSAVALARLLARLDRARFEPEVVVSWESQRELLERHGLGDVRVHVLRMASRRFHCPRPDGRLGRMLVAAAAPPLATLDHLRRVRPYAARLHALIAGRRVDLVHLNNGVLANLGGLVAAARRGVPVVVKQHGYEWHSASVRRAALRVARFMPDSEDVASDLLRLGVPRERLRVTYCPVDLAEPDGPDDRPAVRAELGIPAAAPVFGIVGCLQEWKGQHVFLDAAARVLARLPGARAVVVGAAPEGGDLGYPARLTTAARTLGVAGSVRFTGHRDDVPRVLRALDVCVHASLVPEPFGMVVGEAMAARRPVVASAAGGPLEIVEHGVSGLLVPPGDAGALADAVLVLLSDAPLRHRMGEAGRLRVAQRFSAERHVELTESVYLEVLEGR